MFGTFFARYTLLSNSFLYFQIMDNLNIFKERFHHLITLKERDDGKKNKTLEKETNVPRV